LSRWLSKIGALAQWIGAPLAMIGLLGALLTDLAAWWEKGYWASKPISVLLGHNAEKIQAAGPRAMDGSDRGGAVMDRLGHRRGMSVSCRPMVREPLCR